MKAWKLVVELYILPSCFFLCNVIGSRKEMKIIVNEFKLYAFYFNYQSLHFILAYLILIN